MILPTLIRDYVAIRWYPAPELCDSFLFFLLNKLLVFFLHCTPFNLNLSDSKQRRLEDTFGSMREKTAYSLHQKLSKYRSFLTISYGTDFLIFIKTFLIMVVFESWLKV